MENGLSTLQKYYRIQRVAIIFFFFMVAVSLLLPYSKVDVSSLYVPSVFSRYTIYGYELSLAVIAVLLTLICTILGIITKNRIQSAIAFFTAIFIGIVLLILPEQIGFNRLFMLKSRIEFTYGVGFYLMVVSGIGTIVTAFINLLLVAENAYEARITNSNLIDDLQEPD